MYNLLNLVPKPESRGRYIFFLISISRYPLDVCSLQKWVLQYYGHSIRIFQFKFEFGFDNLNDYQTKAKNRSPAGESFFMPSTMSNNSTTTVINGVTSHHRTDFNGAINHIAVVPPMKSYHNETTSPSQQQKKPFSQQPHNMSLPLRSTSSSSPCQYSLDASKYLL